MASFNVINPYTNKTVSKVPVTSSAEIKRILNSSYEFKQIPNARQRAKILRETAKKLAAQESNIAKLITSESGLCLKDTLREISRAQKVAFFASIVVEKIEKDTTQNYELTADKKAAKLKVITEPFDLVIGITPFNHPLNQVAHKVFSAVAAGACIVLKPSSKTPLSALKLQELLREAGLPEEMFQLVNGIHADQIVDQLISFKNLDSVTFTGGLEVGQRLIRKMVESGNGLKKTVLELGGCSPLIVNDDADLDRAVNVALSGCFGNSGQRCTAIRKIIALKKIADSFVERFAQKTKKLKCGDPFDLNTDMGTLISEEAAKIVENRVNKAIRDGAKLICGNKRLGALYGPTILDFVPAHSELVAQETFGPIGAVLRVKSLEEAIEVANRTQYRLAGAIVTKRKQIAHEVSDRLMVGQFSWNGTPSYRTECAPFGGFKNSGNGEKEGVVHAAYGMRRIRTFYEH